MMPLELPALPILLFQCTNVVPQMSQSEFRWRPNKLNQDKLDQCADGSHGQPHFFRDDVNGYGKKIWEQLCNFCAIIRN